MISTKINLIEKLCLTSIFKMNSHFSKGAVSPYAMQLETLCSYPQLLKEIAKVMFEQLKKTQFDLIAGPCTDIPLATTLSLQFDLPMLFVRNERKQWGMEKLIEGNYHYGQKVVIIDDQITDVATALQLIGRLEGSGLNVVGYHTLFDGQTGEMEYLRKVVNCTSVLTISDILLDLVQKRRISKSQLQRCQLYTESKNHEFKHVNLENAAILHIH